MDFWSGQGANRSDTRRYREDLQRSPGRKDAVFKCQIACNTTPGPANQGPGATDRDCNTGTSNVLADAQGRRPGGCQAVAATGRATRAAPPPPTSTADTTLRPSVTAEP